AVLDVELVPPRILALVEVAVAAGPGIVFVLEPWFRGNEKIPMMFFQMLDQRGGAQPLVAGALGQQPQQEASDRGEIERGYDADRRSPTVESVQPPQHALTIELARRTLSLADQQFQERRFLLRRLRSEKLLVGLRPELDVVVWKRGLLAGVPRV